MKNPGKLNENAKKTIARATGRPRTSRDVHFVANRAAHLLKRSANIEKYTQIYTNVHKYIQMYTNIYKYDKFQTILKTVGKLIPSKICLIISDAKNYLIHN